MEAREWRPDDWPDGFDVVFGQGRDLSSKEVFELGANTMLNAVAEKFQERGGIDFFKILAERDEENKDGF